MSEAIALALPIVIEALRKLATPESQVTEQKLVELLGPQALSELVKAQELLRTLEIANEPT